MPHKTLTKSLHAMTNYCMKANTSEDEIKRLSESDLHWSQTKNSNSNLTKRKIKRGDVYQIEFGKGLFPEIAYEHRALVINRKGHLIYVAPIYSLNLASPYHQNVYHPADNPDGNKDLILLKSIDFDFIKHDSVLKLTELQSVSTKRIKFKRGSMPVNHEIYIDIEQRLHKNLFSKFNLELENSKVNIPVYLDRLQELESELIPSLQDRISELEDEVIALNLQLSQPSE